MAAPPAPEATYIEQLQERARLACLVRDQLFEDAVQASTTTDAHIALESARKAAMDALAVLHAEEHEEEEEEEEEVELRAREAEAHGEEEASVIVVRADGRARRSNAGKAAEKFLPEDIAALPQWGTSHTGAHKKYRGE